METREYSPAQKPTDILLMDLVEVYSELARRCAEINDETKRALYEYSYEAASAVWWPTLYQEGREEASNLRLRRDALLAVLRYEEQEPVQADGQNVLL